MSLIGRAEAILKIAEETLEDTRKANENTGMLSSRLERATCDIDQLREIVIDMRETLKKYQPTDWLTTKQLAQEFKVTQRTIWNWYKAGVIPGHQIEEKGHIFFDRLEVAKVIRERDIHGRRTAGPAG